MWQCNFALNVKYFDKYKLPLLYEHKLIQEGINFIQIQYAYYILYKSMYKQVTKHRMWRNILKVFLLL